MRTQTAKMRLKGYYMNIFYRPHYNSEATQFINELRKKDPELQAKQREGRNLLWDKEIDRNASSGYRAAKVAQKPYVYQTDARVEE